MPGIRIREGESFEGALRRFKKQCEKGGFFSEIKKREHYEKPSVRRRKSLSRRENAILKNCEKIWRLPKCHLRPNC